MPTTYAGNPASFPATIPIPSDGDPRNASSVGTPLEALADRTANLAARAVPKLKSITLTGYDDEFIVPDNVTEIFYKMYGGGGGGGGGHAGADSFLLYSAGGGGGGGAIEVCGSIPVTPGASLFFSAGYRGDGGAPGQDGADGGDSVLGIGSGPSLVQRIARGGQGGKKGGYSGTTGEYFQSLGGAPVRGGYRPFDPSGTSTEVNPRVSVAMPQYGAPGITCQAQAETYRVDGGASPQGYAGGATPQNALSQSGRPGGGSGGGGGAGPGGAGGAGGQGGNGHAGVGQAGDAGNDGAPGGDDTTDPVTGATGAGGGGGGGGGAGNSGTPSGGNGGRGGSGKVTLYWVGV